MRVIVAECSATYAGRGDTKLLPAVRSILIKDDGSISIHNDSSNKPLNYMGKGNVFTETELESGETELRFDTTKESLQIIIHKLFSDFKAPLDDGSSGLLRDGTEKHLHEWLIENSELIDPEWEFVSSEYNTSAGPVDLLFKNSDNTYYCVEVKRVALTSSIHQVMRYHTAIVEDDETLDGLKIVPVVIALEMRPKATTVAERKGVTFIPVPEDWSRRAAQEATDGS